MLKGINLSLYPKEKTHYLAYALQFGLKLPTPSTMRRSERKNMVKNGAAKAANVTGRGLVGVFRHIGKKVFVLPNRFGDKTNLSALNARYNIFRARGRGRGKGKGNNKKV